MNIATPEAKGSGQEPVTFKAAVRLPEIIPEGLDGESHKPIKPTGDIPQVIFSGENQDLGKPSVTRDPGRRAVGSFHGNRFR